MMHGSTNIKLQPIIIIFLINPFSHIPVDFAAVSVTTKRRFQHLLPCG